MLTLKVVVGLVSPSNLQNPDQVGVLTKPDRVDKHDEKNWIKMLRNESYKTAYGYYVTMHMTTEQLRQNMPWEKARAKEQEFLETEAPWCHEDKSRLGTEQLVKALSSRLSHMIEKRFLFQFFRTLIDL